MHVEASLARKGVNPNGEKGKHITDMVWDFRL